MTAVAHFSESCVFLPIKFSHTRLSLNSTCWVTGKLRDYSFFKPKAVLKEMPSSAKAHFA